MVIPSTSRFAGRMNPVVRKEGTRYEALLPHPRISQAD